MRGDVASGETRRHEKYDRLIALAREVAPVATAVAHPCDETSLKGAVDAILLATFTSSMGQFGLLLIPVVTVLDLLSGSTTPMESMPSWLQHVMQFAPTTHYVAFAQAVLYRAAGPGIVWPPLLALAGFTIVFFGVALARFRTAIRL